MQVVLLRSVDNLGTAGDTVEVRPGYYRNFLKPRGFADLATPAVLKLVESRRRKLAALVEREKAAASSARGSLDGVQIEFHLRASEKGQLFGSVTTNDIARELGKLGHNVDRRTIEIGEPIKSLGSHKVRVRLYTGIYAEVKIEVKRQLRPGEEDAESNPAYEETTPMGSAAQGDDDDDY